MKVKQLLDDIEQLTQLQATRQTPVDRFLLLDWLSMELNELVGKAEWDWAMQRVTPVIVTKTGVSSYILPEDFPENFVRFGRDQSGTDNGQGWACMLDDGSNETPLEYVSPASFFTQNLRAASNGRPTMYTILSNPRAEKELHLHQPPDSNSSNHYQIDGLYIPTDWTLDEEYDLPPVPAHSQILKYAVLRRVNPERWGPLYGEAFRDLVMRAANQRRSQVVPVKGRYNQDVYTLMRRR